MVRPFIAQGVYCLQYKRLHLDTQVILVLAAADAQTEVFVTYKIPRTQQIVL